MIKGLPEKTQVFAMRLYLASDCGYPFPLGGDWIETVAGPRQRHLLLLRKQGAISFFFDRNNNHMGFFSDRAEALAALEMGPFEIGAVIKEPMGWKKRKRGGEDSEWVKTCDELSKSEDNPVHFYRWRGEGRHSRYRRGSLGSIGFGGVCPLCGQDSPYLKKMEEDRAEVSVLHQIHQRSYFEDREDRSGLSGSDQGGEHNPVGSIDSGSGGGSSEV